ncbi:DUF4173 domain-containing protein [Aerococcaceae bacterium NML171108]|nr:DUF4173 domain-containing protein [Aerococcaceae bacterium NML171108]
MNTSTELQHLAEQDTQLEKVDTLQSFNDKQRTTLKRIAIISYLVAYVYIIVMGSPNPSFLFLLSLALIAVVELVSHCLGLPFSAIREKDSHLETWTFMLTTLAQALALSIWGYHYQLGFLQFLGVHACFILYVIARNGLFTQEKLGILFWVDILRYTFVVPLKNFFLRERVLHYHSSEDASTQGKQDAHKNKIKSLALIAITLVVTFYLIGFAWSQLTQVSDKFAELTGTFHAQLFEWIASYFNSYNTEQFITQLILSIPVGMWLFGLIAGSLVTHKPQNTYEKFQAQLNPFRVFPQITAYIVIGGLCFIYGLFFVIAMSEMGALLSINQQAANISPQEASNVAVSGFWQLVKVSLMNFGVLAAFYVFADKPLWDTKGTRNALTLLFIFATLFALLAGWKLFGIYMYLYGPTPLRLLSGWFILVLLVWCILTLIRLYKPIHAIRFGVLYATLSFTILCYAYAYFIQ